VPLPGQSALALTNQFGSVTVGLRKPTHLLVPSAKGLTDPVNPPDLATLEASHFTCYQAKVTRGTPFAVEAGVAVDDQLLDGTGRMFDLRKPTRLRVPAAKTRLAPVPGPQPRHPPDHLLLYQALLSRTKPAQARIPKTRGTECARGGVRGVPAGSNL